MFAFAVTVALSGTAYAYDETGLSDYGVTGTCIGCHERTPVKSARPAACGGCHEYSSGDFPFQGAFAQQGPHGVYNASTSRCDMCHTLHDAPTSFKLLPGETVTDTCFTCHDGTGGFGVYGAIEARGLTVGGGHSVDTTNAVPGGDAATGGSAAVAFRSSGSTLTCSDCHSPHQTNTVAPFPGERIRLRAAPVDYTYSDRLLKKRPTGASADVDQYGSDWCAGCHRGRTSSGMVVNHPVESKLTQPTPYHYNYLPVIPVPDSTRYKNGSLQPATQVILGGIGTIATPGGERHPTPKDTSVGGLVYNSPWLMVYPRAPLQAGHAPICQQCHEDSRDCGDLSEDGATAWVRGDRLDTVEADGRTGTAYYPWMSPPNPLFQNFPHETQNVNMLVETEDDLCLNCHAPGRLP